jgi:Protein of unknown function (DUF1153)
MGEIYPFTEGAVLGPDGRWLTLADLPAPDTKRWVPRRKAEIVAAVRGGLLTLDEACERYALTVEEYLGWQRNVERYGMQGLRATHHEVQKEPHRRGHSSHHATEHRVHH